MFTLEGTDAEKRAFGLALMQLGDANSAGRLVFPDAPGKALGAGICWMNDPIVLSVQNMFPPRDADILLTREQLCARILSLADSNILASDSIAAYKLYADLAGYLAKDAAITNNVILNKVMMYKDNGNNDDWEAKLMQQQNKLIDVAAQN